MWWHLAPSYKLNRKVHMANDEARKELLEMMFEALLKKRFSQFAKKYGRGPVVHTWAEIVKGGGIKAFLGEREWGSHAKIIDVLDCLDDYCDSVGSMIQTTIKGRMEKNDSTLRNYVEVRRCLDSL